ncbi:MAG: nucleotide-binding protein [Puniceicoccales bacterium]|jgi:hypothetical protein|nr:nucleotide-binding protein [Puniceicoccales bacterium]
MSDSEELLQLANELDKVSINVNQKSIQSLKDAAQRTGKSWCGSWLGYHSRVYYKNLESVPPGARFSVEWGFGDRLSNETCGDWAEYNFDDVVAQIEEWAKSPDKKALQSAAKEIATKNEDAQSRMLSILSRFRTRQPDDKFIEDMEESIKSEKCPVYSDLIRVFQGKKQWFTRDALAVGQGIQTPPHIHVLAEAGTYEFPFLMCANLSKYARRAGSHMASFEEKSKQTSRIGTHVFIGHGRSNTWKEFRDFIRDRIHLPWDEFNRVPVAGIPTTTRLMEMLNQAAIAILILTAEDDQADGKMHPRMNVIHEAGLFREGLVWSGQSYFWRKVARNSAIYMVSGRSDFRKEILLKHLKKFAAC